MPWEQKGRSPEKLVSAWPPKASAPEHSGAISFAVYCSVMVEMRCTVYGKVQGVQYRVYAQDSAVELGVVGYVRNLPDGSVEVLAQGMPEVLKEFVEYLYEGSLLARVESVSVEWQSAQETFTEFSVLH